MTPPIEPTSGLDQATSKLIFSSDLANIVKKVKAGKPLSPSERRIIKQATQAEQEEVAKVTPKARQKSSAAGKEGWRDRFIAAMADVPNVDRACEVSHISRKTVYQERKRSQVFHNRWDEALAKGIERLEAACWDRARTGVKRGVWMKGADGEPRKVDEIREFSDTLAMFLLKAHHPEKYRETVHTRTELGGLDGKPIAVEQKQNEPIDFAEFQRVAGEMFAISQPNGHPEPVHPAPPDRKAGDLPEPG
jgi:uncharacterized membrane protein